MPPAHIAASETVFEKHREEIEKQIHGFEIAFVPVRFDHVASIIVNADDSIMRPAAMLRVADCIRDSVSIAITTADRMAAHQK